MSAARQGRMRGFSLIELVIVVVIIGIIAAIAIPRMTHATQGAEEASLEGDLKVIRHALEIYAAEHGGTHPGEDGGNAAAQLTQYSNASGQTNTTRTNEYIYGPYLREAPPLPVGEKKGKAGMEVVSDPAAKPPGTNGNAGWWYNSAHGAVRANLPDGAKSSNGKPFNKF